MTADSKYDKCVNVTKSYNVGVLLFAAGRQKFSKRLSVECLYSECIRALTLENFCSNPVLRKRLAMLSWELQREIQRAVLHPRTRLEANLQHTSGIGVVEQYILSCALEHRGLALDLDTAWNMCVYVYVCVCVCVCVCTCVCIQIQITEI